MANPVELKPQDKLNFQVTVTLTKQQVDALNATQKDLNGMATFLLHEAARGGMMLPTEVLQDIERTAGRMAAPEDLIRAIERKNSRDRGRLRAEIFLDPVDETYYRDLAQSRGETSQHLFQDSIDYYMDQGWLGTQLPESPRIKLTNEQRLTLEEVLGVQPVTGSDIVDFILEHATLPQPLTPKK